MKAAETKPSAKPANKSTPFFSKENGSDFFGGNTAEATFFSKTNTISGIQTKLTIRQPNDKYEVEADAMADKVVQRLATPGQLTTKETGVQTKPLSANISPFIQTKCSTCEQEEKLQKKEEDEESLTNKKLQLKQLSENFSEPPVGEKPEQLKQANLLPADKSEAKVVPPSGNKVQSLNRPEPVQPKLLTTATAPKLQTRCATCDPEEKLHKKEEQEENSKEEKLQKKPVFDLNGEVSPKAGDVQRKCAECEKEEKLQTKSKGTKPTEVTNLESNLASSKGSGNALPDETRAQMEGSLGAELGNIKIHTGASAVQMNQQLNARAFTHGRNIYFNAGQFAPSTTTGKHLLAHELTHTVQQGAVYPSGNAARGISTNGSGNKINRLTFEERLTKANEVHDLLEGWTSSADSASILTIFTGLAVADVNSILNAIALKENSSVMEVYKWMYSDMVTSDWKALVKILIKVKAEDVANIIAYVVLDMLNGWTSEDDSKEIKYYLSEVTGTQLDSVLSAMESQSGYDQAAMVAFLFGDLSVTDAHHLSIAFFGTGSLKAIQYAVDWYAGKIFALLEGYTSIADSQSIRQNFERVPDSDSRIAVLTKLDSLSTAAWGQSAANAMSEDMRQADYNAVKLLLPQLPEYNIENNFLDGAWDLIETGYDYVEGFIEYLSCGLFGVVVGIFDAIVSIVSGVIDIVFAIKNLIGWLISKASGGKFGRESEENVNNFFSSVGEALGAPGDLISRMWEETKLEASLIEGPFTECKLAIFWIRKVTNFVVNILLLLFAGYGAVKAAIEAVEVIKNISTFAEFASKIGKIPVAILRKVKTLPASLATGGSRIISAIRNVDQVITGVRKTLGLIRLAASDENFYLNLRRAAGEIAKDKLQAERDFWKARKEKWSNTATAEEQNLAKSENLANQATKDAETNPSVAEQQAVQAEEQALTSQNKANSAEREAKSGQSAEERSARKPGEGISPETQAWENSLNSETKAMLEADPELRRFWQDMDPSVRRALTYCNTPCIPITVSPENLKLIQALMKRLNIPDTNLSLREYLHIYRNNQDELANAIKALDTVKNLQEFETFIDNRLIALIKQSHGVTIRRGANGLWEYPLADGTVIREFEIGTHKFLTANRGTNSFFQSHHGIQDAWAQQKFKGLGVYSREEAPTLLLRSRNLEGGSRGTPHGIIGDSQGTRKASRTFAEELKALDKDLTIIGAPANTQTAYLAEVNKYFTNIYNQLSAKLTKTELDNIFGDWHP